MTGSKSATLLNKNEQASSPVGTLGDRLITVTFDASMPLRPQWASAKALVTDFALAWIKRNPDNKPLRVAKRKNKVFYIECRLIAAMLRDGVPREAIQRELWPAVDGELQRRRFNYRVARWRKLVAGHYLELVSTD